MKVQSNKRRRLLVDKPFQLRLIGLGLVYSLIAVGVFAWCVFGPIILDLNSGKISDPEVQAAAEQFLTLHLRVWPALLVVLVFLTLHHVVESHRIAGPLCRIRTTLEDMSKGDISARIVIRKKDYLAKEAAAVNDLLAFLREQINGLDDDYWAISAATAGLHNAVDPVSAEGVRQKIERLDTCMQQFRLRLDRFTTEGAPSPSTKQNVDRARGGSPHSSGHREHRGADSLANARS